ncbi:MAG: hypothetical protein JWL81_886 [Verrucomicrobiales bacterium]|nr:hypothetical protein [Verrucomicrobiales bacterium]
MEPVWYFISRAVGTLIPLLLLSYASGLWTGWIKWHTWKREYNEVERDYHKLHDIHDVARATIPELEQRRQALTDEILQKEDALERIREANEKYEEESRKLNQSLHATKRNYEAMEDIWRGKIAAADIRIIELETALKHAGERGQGALVKDERDKKDKKDGKDGKDDAGADAERVAGDGAGMGEEAGKSLVPAENPAVAEAAGPRPAEEQDRLFLFPTPVEGSGDASPGSMDDARAKGISSKSPNRKQKRPQAVS